MLNQIVLVGRLAEELELKEEGGKKKVILTWAVPRSWKNEEGLFETDYIKCILWDNIATNTSEYCKKGDIIGIKGRIQTEEIILNDGTKDYKNTIIAEKVTFLSSTKEKE